jgi:hypothetical protein
MAKSLEAPWLDNRSASQQTIIDHTWVCVSALVTDADPDAALSAVAAKTVASMALDYQYSDENFEDFVSHFWLTVLWLAKQLAPTSPIHAKIVAMLLELQKQPPPSLQPKNRPFWYIFWEGLPGITLAIFQYRYGAPSNPTYAERLGPYANRKYSVTLTATEWTNLNAFLARLLEAIGHQTTKGASYLAFQLASEGLYCLLDALEDRNTVDQQADYMPSAACWILYAGRQLNEMTQYHPHQGPERISRRFPWSAGDLYEGPVGFNKEHWGFWKERFETLKEDESLDEVTRDWATKSWEEMGAIEAERTAS